MKEIKWRQDGYRLFNISVFIGERNPGWYKSVFESNCLFLNSSLFHLLGGYEERFNYPGGGFANMDFFQRAMMHPGAQVVCLLGEGGFHQLHGGTITNATPEHKEVLLQEYKAQYKSIRGEEYRFAKHSPEFIGRCPKQPGEYFANQ